MYGKRFRKRAPKGSRKGRRAVRRVYKRRSSVRATQLVPMVKKIIRGAQETKSVRQTGSLSNVLHRDSFYVTPFTVISNGTGDNNKVGNRVWVKGVALRMNMIRSSSFFNDIKMRVVAFHNPRNEIDTSELFQANWAGGGTVITPNLFFNEGSNLEYIRHQWLGIKPVIDRTFYIKSNNFGSATSNVTQSARPFNIWIPLNQYVNYQDKGGGGSQQPVRNLILYVYFYGGGLISSDLNILFSSIQSEYRVYFKDDC